MIITQCTESKIIPSLSINKSIVKIDFSIFIFEMGIEEFKNIITSLITEAARQNIYIPTLK